MTSSKFGDSFVEFMLHDEEQTRELGKRIAAQCAPGDFIGLVGELGAGKTTFVQGLLQVLSPDAHVSSPTYTLLNIYDSTPPVYHFDLYRLGDAEDLEGIGYWDYVEGKRGVSCVEWLDRVPEAWPGKGLVVVLEHLPEGRLVRIFGGGEQFVPV